MIGNLFRAGLEIRLFLLLYLNNCLSHFISRQYFWFDSALFQQPQRLDLLFVQFVFFQHFIVLMRNLFWNHEFVKKWNYGPDKWLVQKFSIDCKLYTVSASSSFWNRITKLFVNCSLWLAWIHSFVKNIDLVPLKRRLLVRTLKFGIAFGVKDSTIFWKEKREKKPL
jgi:hypothetical protein